MIDEALFRYSADKTGVADFALESGGMIIGRRTYNLFIFRNKS